MSLYKSVRCLACIAGGFLGNTWMVHLLLTKMANILGKFGDWRHHLELQSMSRSWIPTAIAQHPGFGGSTIWGRRCLSRKVVCSVPAVPVMNCSRGLCDKKCWLLLRCAALLRCVCFARWVVLHFRMVERCGKWSNLPSADYCRPVPQSLLIGLPLVSASVPKWCAITCMNSSSLRTAVEYLYSKCALRNQAWLWGIRFPIRLLSAWTYFAAVANWQCWIILCFGQIFGCLEACIILWTLGCRILASAVLVVTLQKPMEIH